MTRLSIEAALRAVQVGLTKAVELGEPSSVAICDAGGNLLAFGRSDDGAFGTIDVAVNKAYTAAAFKCSTADLFQDSQPGGEIYGLITASSNRPFVVFGGGLPILVDGTVAGAVGVSGGPVSADVAIAEAAKSAIEG